MSWLKAFFAGIVGAALITVMLSIAISAGFHVMDFSMMWGTLVGLPVGWVAWMVGFAINLLVGGIFALWYAVLFKLFSGAGLLRGLFIGIAHAFITGLIMPLLPLVHPLMNNGQMASPGPYFSEHGTAGVFFFFALHLVYGATVGWLYSRLVPSARHTVESNDLRIAA